MIRGSLIVFCSNPPGGFGSSADITGQSKVFAMVIRLTSNPRTRQKRICLNSLSHLVTTGEVNGLACLSRTDKVLRVRLRQILIAICLLASLGKVEPMAAAESTSRRTIQTSDGVTLSVLEAGQRHGDGSGLTIACIPGWLMPA